VLGSLLFSTALAGSVYINQVRVEPSDLAGLELKAVDVRLDAAGNVWIAAEGYTVRPVGPDGKPVEAPVVPGPPPEPYVAKAPGPVTTPASASGTTTIPPGQWWLYVDDGGSTGHTVDVTINGTLVTTVRSGGDPLILDVGKWLRPGTNTVRCEAMSAAPTGGPLYVFLGSGSDNNGTVEMGTPDIQFGVGRSRSGETSRTFTLEVNP
jgi:hypothetical protein